MHQKRTLPVSGFTLVELLVVVAIIAILVGISIPSVTGLLRGSRLTTASNVVSSQLTIARQYAMANNCQVEVRFYQLPDTSTGSSTTPAVYRGLQSYSISGSGLTATPVTKLLFLPDQVCIVNNTTVSSLLNPQSPAPYYVLGSSTTASAGSYPPSSYNYTAFHFKPDGSTDLNPSSIYSWYLSIANQHDTNQGTTGLPINFVTLQIDALTGRVRYYRPN